MNIVDKDQYPTIYVNAMKRDVETFKEDARSYVFISKKWYLPH
jgi:hypothetical protein